MMAALFIENPMVASKFPQKQIPKVILRLAPRLAPWQIPIATSLAMLLAFLMGPQFPSLGIVLKPYAKYNLSILLLINTLHISYRSLGAVLLRHPLLLSYGIVVKNVLLPLSVFALCYFLWPSALPAAILLSGTSSGFSAVSFAILLRLAPEINLLLTLGTSFLVPFSLPFLLYLLAGSSVEIDLLGMMLQMAWMIFVPLVLERLFYFGCRNLHTWFKNRSQPITTINMSLSAFILMLSGQELLRRQASNLFWYILFFSAFIMLFVFVFSLLWFFRSTLETQMIMLIGNTSSNTGLASVIALDYFDNLTLTTIIIFIVLWNFNIAFLYIWPPLRRALIAIFMPQRDNADDLL